MLNNGTERATERIHRSASTPRLRWWQPVLLSAMAGGLGWGIRGQYGHETGAMIAGALVALVLVFLFCPDAPALSAARAAAWCTVAVGFGGSMTYAQTIGLTHDAGMIGNWAALRWGLLGLALKGGIWIGFAGVFLGMGLGGVRYRPVELLGLMAGLAVLYFAGTWLLNRPFDPGQRVLPPIYFSADWRWNPNAAALKPRREDWGGLLLALAGLLLFAGRWKRDRLARNLGMWAILGGVVGFPLGQCLQAFHAWNPDLFQHGLWTRLDPLMNWWNMMETSFGAIMGGTIGAGLWLNRSRIAPLNPPAVSMPAGIEWLLLTVHISLLIIGEFMFVPVLGRIADVGLLMGVIPMVAIAGGRWWPYLLTLPVAMLPIAGKTIRQLCYREQTLPPFAGWVVYGAVPLAAMIWTAVRLARAPEAGANGAGFARPALLLSVWFYFTLNFAFFHFPWPWAAWTSRTPNGIIYAICAAGLTAAALWAHRAPTAKPG